jgi:hypothetical protein
VRLFEQATAQILTKSARLIQLGLVWAFQNIFMSLIVCLIFSSEIMQSFKKPKPTLVRSAEQTCSVSVPLPAQKVALCEENANFA